MDWKVSSPQLCGTIGYSSRRKAWPDSGHWQSSVTWEGRQEKWRGRVEEQRWGRKQEILVKVSVRW